jgi:hypothetical protein
MARQTRQFPQGKYILRTPRKSQNGEVYAVYLYYYWKGKQLRRSVDNYVRRGKYMLESEKLENTELYRYFYNMYPESEKLVRELR